MWSYASLIRLHLQLRPRQRPASYSKLDQTTLIYLAPWQDQYKKPSASVPLLSSPSRCGKTASRHLRSSSKDCAAQRIAQSVGTKQPPCGLCAIHTLYFGICVSSFSSLLFSPLPLKLWRVLTSNLVGLPRWSVAKPAECRLASGFTFWKPLIYFDRFDWHFIFSLSLLAWSTT